MLWQGKALGALIGVLTAGPVGALFGTFIGHLFDVQASSGMASRAQASSIGVQEAFFRATFQVMGHLAKADGRVSEDEIRAARAIMEEFHLGERERKFAIELYTDGKRREFPLEATLAELARLCGNRPDLRRMFVQIQLQVALWGASLDPAGRNVLARVCAALDISPYEVVQMEALLRMQRASRQPGAQPAADRLGEAYAVLG